QKYTRGFADTICDNRALCQFELKRGTNEFYRDLEQLLGKRYQLIRRQAAMPFVHGFGQRIGNSGANPHHRGLLNAEFPRDRIGGLETDAADVTREAIGIFRHDPHGVRAVGPVNAHRSRRADTVTVKEEHDFADDLLLGPGRGDTARSYRTNACYLA